MNHLETANLCDRVAALFPEHTWTDAEFEVFRSAVFRYAHGVAYDAIGELKTTYRFKSPSVADVLNAIKARAHPQTNGPQHKATEKQRESDQQVTARKEAEARVSRNLHIPELLDRGREHVEAGRDRLIQRMADGDFASQRKVAGCPTWEELTDPNDTRPRILCWRYWIIMDSFESYEPEVLNT